MSPDTLPTVFPSDGHWPDLDDAFKRWDLERLTAGVDQLAGGDTASVVILDHGRLVLERHWAPDGTLQLDDVASVQKSLIAVLVGIAVDRGLLAIDEPAATYLEPGWTRLDRLHEARITVRHLLTMTSGLSSSLEYDAGPGTQWSYNTMAYQMLKPLLAAATGQPLDELTTEWLTGPIGMKATAWVPRDPIMIPEGAPEQLLDGLRKQGFVQDPNGRWAHRMPNGSLVSGLYSTARDLARLGLLVSTYGQWDGSQILPADWLRRALRSSQDRNPAYGWLFWLGGRPGLPVGKAVHSVRARCPDRPRRRSRSQPTTDGHLAVAGRRRDQNRSSIRRKAGRRKPARGPAALVRDHGRPPVMVETAVASPCPRTDSRSRHRVGRHGL